MTGIYLNIPSTMLAMTAMSLLIFGISIQNASATSSEIRMLADLSPPINVGGLADGRADYRETGNSMRLNVEVEDVSPNTTFTIEVSGNTLGTITTNSFGTAELELNTNDGHVVPKALRGDIVEIFQGTEPVLSGTFSEGVGDGNIEDDDNQSPITPAQNSSMQAGNNNSSAALATVPSSNNTLQDGTPVNATTSRNNTTIENLQQEIIALQQTVNALQQALTSLQQQAAPSQDGNVTVSSGNNTTTSVS